jgi:hypothetical protein
MYLSKSGLKNKLKSIVTTTNYKFNFSLNHINMIKINYTTSIFTFDPPTFETKHMFR